MAQAGSLATKKLFAILISPEGVPAAVSVIGDLDRTHAPVFSADQIAAQNVAPEVAERSTAVRYPGVNVYCSSVNNLQREKFRTFSGEAEMIVEARVSQDRLEGLEAKSQLYIDAVTRVLDQNRGDWGDGVSYNGGYQINYGPVKHGGRNFLQIAKITFTLDISND